MNSVKLQGKKIIKMFQVSLYTNNGLSERENLKKKIPFTIASKIIKYLGINLIKEVKDLRCTLKTIKYWWKKLKTTQINGKIYHAHGLEELILFKWSYYPKQSTNSMQSLSKFQWHFSKKQNKQS